MNKIFRFLNLLLLIAILSVGCTSQATENEVLTDEEISEILSSIVGGEDVVLERALAYFNGLSSENTNLIKPEELYKIVQAGGDDFYILDIRKEEDFIAGHIEGANNIFWYDIGDRIAELPKDKRIFITCYSGQSGGQVLGVLKTLGYDIVSLAGGMNNGWIKSELPLVK